MTDGLAAYLGYWFFRLVIQPKNRPSFFDVVFLSGDLHAEWRRTPDFAAP